jgi:hypothetical protein
VKYFGSGFLFCADPERASVIHCEHKRVLKVNKVRSVVQPAISEGYRTACGRKACRVIIDITRDNIRLK